MHSQGNYSIQIGQDPYARPPPFQEHPSTTAPPRSHYGPQAPQSQVIQHGNPAHHPRPGAVAYQHVMTSVHQGMSSAQSYGHYPRPPQIRNQISHSYPSIEQQSLPWSQNMHQLPPPPPRPPQGPSVYQLPSSQGHTLERGPSHQHPSHAPLPPPPPYLSSSVLPLPPPPPLPPSHPRAPPLPPSSPSSDILSNKEGNHSWKGLPDGDNMELERSRSGKATDDRSVHVKVQFQPTESGIQVGSLDAEAACSPTDSDMDMEDDITYPDEEKKNCLSVNSNDGWGSMSQEDYAGEKLQPLPEISLRENLSSIEVSIAKAEVSEVASDCNFPATMKEFSRTESGTTGNEFCRTESGTTGNGQNDISLDTSIKMLSSQNKNSGKSPGRVVHSESGCEELYGQPMKGENSFKILQGYSSNSTSENEDPNLGDASPLSINDETTKSDDEKGHDLGSVLRHKSLSDPECGSPRNVMQADKLAIPTRAVAESSDISHSGRRPVSTSTSDACQSKDSSRNHGEDIGSEEANAHKPDMKSDKLKVDEFGRLVREDVSHSDTSNSPPDARRHSRRTRKRSRSQSRSRSPHDRRRRRRRSPWRRTERRGRSRSFSPRRRSRSRSPVLRRDTEYSGDKLRREKGQLPGCFDFLRGKCYRGATCRYSHHESDKTGRSRYDRGKHHNRDAPPTLRSPVFDEESKVLTEKERMDKAGLSQELPDFGEPKDAKRLPVNSTSPSPDEIENLSGDLALDTLSGKHSYLFPESAAKYSDKIHQVVDQEFKRNDSLPTESSSLAPTHHPADRQDRESQLHSAESHLTKPYPNQEFPSWSLSPAIANHPSQLSIPLPPTSQPVGASFALSILQNYNSSPPTSQNQLTPQNYSTYVAPAAYQHSHFPGPLKSVSSSHLPPPPLPPPPPQLPLLPTSSEHSTSQHMHQSLPPPWSGYSNTSIRSQQTEMPTRPQMGEYNAYPFAREPDQMLQRTDGYGLSSLHASNLTSQEGGPRMMGESHLPVDSLQGIDSSKSFIQAQTNPLSRSPFKGMHNSLGSGLSSDGNSSHGHPDFQQASYGLQYSTGGDVHSKLAEPGMLSPYKSRVSEDFLDRNRSYVHSIVGSKISNHFNPYASTFDLPLSSKLSSSTLVRENDATTTSTKYGTLVSLSSVPIDPHRIQSSGTNNMVSSSFVLPDENVSRPGGNQYDPLFDSIEQKSNSSSKAVHQKHETIGDSDDVLGFHGSGRLLNADAIKHEAETAVSPYDSLEKEECGETADVAAGAVLDSSPSNPNDATDMNAGEFEIDQVMTSGKKKKSKEKSAKLFKSSIAAFVKEVLKPSWRQGNMSKEAFKTIVKKTVDKVSGAMKGHQIPKSQAKVNHYIDSSRGKLTKLVMGYVDKYVKV